MLLYLVRHAQSEANAGQPGATRDCPLTALGRRQAAAVGARLAELGIDRVVASPYVRTLETAEAIRRATGAPAAVVPLLHEHHVQPFDGGEWPLLSRERLSHDFPGFELPADFAFGPGWHDVPETEGAVLRRAHRVLDSLWETYGAAEGGDQQARLAVVSHGSPTGKLLVAALRLQVPEGATVRLRIDNASLSVVELFPDYRVLVASNRTDHLAHLEEPGARTDPGFHQPP